MPLRIAYDTPADPGWLQVQLRRLRLEWEARGIRRDDLKKKKKTLQFKDKPYREEYLADMGWIKEHCPLIHVPARGTGIFDDDIRIVRALDKGPAKGLRLDEIDAILSRVVGETFFGKKWNWPISREFCFDRFLGLRFDRAGRQELYRRLNNLMSAKFGGSGKKIRLANAMKSYKNHSLLMQVAVAEPRQARDESPPDLEEYRQQYEQALELMPETMAQHGRGQLAWAIRALRRRYAEDLRTKLPPGYDGRTHYGEWRTFFNELVGFFDRQGAEDIWPGWFGPDSTPMKSFLAHAGFRGTRGSCRPPAYNKGQEAGHARW